MNYYNRHITDYRSATAHLSWDEDAAYSRLLDIYYATEKPLPADINQVCRLARAAKPAHKAAVETVLAEFFVLEADGWHQQRCDEELIIAAARARRARENGTRGGRPGKPDGNPEITQPVSTPPPDGNPGGSYARASHSPFPIPQEGSDAIASLGANDEQRSDCDRNRGTEGAELGSPAEPLREAPRKASGRGIRLDPDFEPSAASRALCRELGLDVERERVQFCGYWCALPGPKALKLDWDLTFQNRCRDVAARGAGVGGAGQRGPGKQAVSVIEAGADVLAAFERRQSRAGGL